MDGSLAQKINMMIKSAVIRKQIEEIAGTSRPQELLTLKLLLDVRDVLIQLAVRGKGEEQA